MQRLFFCFLIDVSNSNLKELWTSICTKEWMANSPLWKTVIENFASVCDCSFCFKLFLLFLFLASYYFFISQSSWRSTIAIAHFFSKAILSGNVTLPLLLDNGKFTKKNILLIHRLWMVFLWEKYKLSYGQLSFFFVRNLNIFLQS